MRDREATTEKSNFFSFTHSPLNKTTTIMICFFVKNELKTECDSQCIVGKMLEVKETNRYETTTTTKRTCFVNAIVLLPEAVFIFVRSHRFVCWCCCVLVIPFRHIRLPFYIILFFFFFLLNRSSIACGRALAVL